MHGLAVYVKEGLPFAWDLSVENSADSYLCFQLALLHSVSYFFFLYRSPSSALCTVFYSISSNIDEVLSINPSANVFVFGDFNVHHKDWLTYSSGIDGPGEHCYNFSISNDLTQMVNVRTRIPDCDSHSPALLDSFLSSYASICSTMAFAPLGNSDHVVVSVSIGFPTNLQQDAPFHRIAYDYSHADWDGLHDHLRDVPWEDIFKLSASAAASEFCQWDWVGIDVYIPHRKYQVKPHSSPWFSAACAAAIVHRNYFFYLYQREKSSDSKVKFRQASNRCKRVLQAAKLAYANKTKDSITSQKLGSRGFWQIANSVLNKGKSAIPPLFNEPEVLSSASDKAKLFAENFSLNSNLDDSGVSLPVFPSRTNLKLHNISVTPKMVRKVVMNLDLSKASGPDCIPVVVLKNCELELSYILAELFNKCLKESCFPDCWKASSVVPVFKNVGERSTAKNYHPVSLLSVVSRVFEKLVNNRIVDHLEKCGLFSDFQYGLRSCRSTADLLTVVSDRIARVFNRSGATRAVALDISKAFDRVWHAGLLHKLKSYGISGQIFGLISSFLSNRLCVVLDGKSSQEYPVNAGVPQGSILGATLFLLYINDLPDDVICDIGIYADDTTLYSKCDLASDLWQQLELVSDFESDLRDTVDWGKKWLVDFNAGKTQLVSFDQSNNNGAIDVKMAGSILEEKSSIKMLGLTFSSKLDWGSYIISIAKTASKKIGALICSMKFLSSKVALYLYKFTICSFMEYCCHVWAGAPSCYLDLLDKLQKRICRIVGPLLAASLEPLAHRRNVASLSLFYRYYFGRCSSELAQLVPLPFCRWKPTRYSDRLHDFSVTIPRLYKDVYVNSFFPRTAKLWNSLPIECFPLTYDLSCYKSRINRHLLTVGSF